MHVTVAIVGFRNPTDISRCLAALGRSAYADFDVVICENGGPESYAALTAVLPAALPGGQGVRAVLAAGNLGYAGGVNVCLKESASADAWWVLNPDTEPHADAMGLQVARLAVGDCDAVGCELYLPNGNTQSYGGAWQPWLARAVSIGHGSPSGSIVDPLVVEKRQNYLNGASMFFGRRFVEQTGLMKEEYFLYCEEVEWCLRAMRRGMRLGVEVKAKVLHHQGTTTGNVLSVSNRSRMPIYLSERNKILLTRDIYAGIFPIVVVSAFLMLFAKYARRRAWRQLGYGIDGWWAGLRNERGPPITVGR